MLQLFMAISPILIVMIGIVGLKKPATIVSAIALIYTSLSQCFMGNSSWKMQFFSQKQQKVLSKGQKWYL